MSVSRKGARVRATAAEIVDAVVTDGRSLDAAIENLEANVAEDDRSLLRNICFGAVRNHWQLREWASKLVNRPLKKRDSVVAALLDVGLFQLSGTRIPDHAVVSQTVEAARLLRRPKLAGLVNAVLRRFVRDNVASSDAGSDEARCNHPQWLIDAIRRDWPDDWQDIIAANNERAPMWLRANASKGSAEDYLERLEAADIGASLFAAAENAILLDEPRNVSELLGFDEGAASVQDAAAQFAAPWLLAGDSGRTRRPGRILDACAAPGGKTGHLLELGVTELTSIDKDEKRLADVARTLDRLDFNATVRLADASNPEEWWDRKPFDGILLDAPCSASGVIRRHPDIKLLRRETDIDGLRELQTAFLGALWPLLAPGGRLLYATCSVLAAENDDVVGAFLAATPDAQENDMLQNNNIRDVMRPKGCGYQILPGTAGMDGFYYACLEDILRWPVPDSTGVCRRYVVP